MGARCTAAPGPRGRHRTLVLRTQNLDRRKAFRGNKFATARQTAAQGESSSNGQSQKDVKEQSERGLLGTTPDDICESAT